MNFGRMLFRFLVLFAIITSTQFFCSTYYQLQGTDTIATEEARLEIDTTAFFAVLAVPNSLKNSNSILILPSLTIAAGLPVPKVEDAISTSLYDKAEVKKCASSISSSIILSESIDSGFISASACKLKKLR
ncbi:hypothetical protein JWG45_14460 [Leptospira sp. 201903070]|uniref:TIGR04452 family lipoprotein n=1 Tax=Leptospira ainlahdjerensis TaxID=2810033 RepID=A0ABS2UEH9_9LEPT|nr:hypothetical protein [Leptospira ainlahdjerensis]MBM9578353.1 hypothetical protein [Leptospira ainlahdjerensis]